MTTVSPIWVCAVLTTDPQPVMTPQLTRAATRSGIAGSTLTQAFWETTAYCENVPYAAESAESPGRKRGRPALKAKSAVGHRSHARPAAALAQAPPAR